MIGFGGVVSMDAFNKFALLFAIGGKEVTSDLFSLMLFLAQIISSYF